ncbi:hypothetical protein A3C37_01375 [Candidatus Peribacteria bacterium RIFCSPHIGHO2_02_FULL_53_20]|nr:MAG: hypothetical protein A3C37_01375 [Candidatus Peribacteria bacterium RIFCSPHIGHO2_02_FULL_53_20]OGJ67620.1 MAG: hypothetical protein A3B61_02055 [Candidatus Peribacteria bacterium RIFCSPLOWO2_01_FULL_53_10]OGJ74992.1 MAG: hypothetical protein A3G69_00690 [Candidatus Peribacteria bacterium RIFCSPLOWO2_12_FULL_53_10]
MVTLDDILEGSQKVQKGLAVETKSMLKGTRFYKVRIGKKGDARMIVFLVTESKKIVPVLIRLKKDKIFGMNMAMNNTQVVDQIRKNLDHIIHDMEKGRFEEFAS